MTVRPFLGFQDGKAPDALRTIGEVAKAFDIRPHVLRYWEEQFPMLQPLTRAGGRRYYRPEDVALLTEISRLLYQEGFTIRGARQALSDAAKGRGASSTEGAGTIGAVGGSGAVGPEVGAQAPTAKAEQALPVLGPVLATDQRDNAVRDRLIAVRHQLADALAVG